MDKKIKRKKTLKTLSKNVEQRILFRIFISLNKICDIYIYGNIDKCNQCFIFEKNKDNDIFTF